MMGRSWRWFVLLSFALVLLTGCSATNDDPGDATTDPPPLPTVIGGTDTASQPDVGEDTSAVKPPDGPCAGKPDGVTCDDGDACTLGDGCEAGVCVGGQNDPCDAEGPCRIGWCEPETGCIYEDAAEGAACGVACFDSASCQAGKCEPEPASGTVCPEPEAPCVDQLGCDQSTGECTVEIYKPAGSDCDTDDNICSYEACDGDGACEFTGENETCEDENTNNPCWTWTCTPKTGCIQAAFVLGVSCNDGNPCTFSDLCTENEFGQSLCLGSPVPLDDNNDCTDDQCIDGEVIHTPILGVPCPSTDPCSTDGTCDDTAACVPTTPCVCYADTDCPEPTDLCVGEAFCDDTGAEPVCANKPGTEVVCDPATSPCHETTCDPDSGVCSEVPVTDGTSCDDESACTLTEVCIAGECVPQTFETCDDGLFCNGIETCAAATGCVPADAPTLDDGVACTIDACNEETDQVTHTPDDAACDDGDLCDGADTCDIALGCQSTDPVDCSAYEGTCIQTQCNSATGACDLQKTEGEACDDGDVSTSGDACDAQGDCVGQPIPCETNQCIATGTPNGEVCLYTWIPVDTPCDDTQNDTQGDACDGQGGCAGTPLNCEPKQCEATSTPDGTGCVPEFKGAGVACDDEDPTTKVDVCDGAGECTGEPYECVPKECEASSNHDGTDCVPEFKGAGVGCDDGDACTTQDVCADGGCQGGPALVCDNGLFCDGQETCHSVKGCQNGSVPAITDQVACTVDTCDEDNDKIVHTPDDNACDNTLFCDGVEACDVSEGCISGASPALDDNNTCTVDACDDTNDVVTHTPTDKLCDDGQYCTGTETCDAAKGCQSGPAPTLDDGFACTVDVCDEAKDEVLHIAQDFSCNDGDVCNGQETCDEAAGCVNGVALTCDDGKACNGLETCAPASGCKPGPLPQCDDSDACNGLETCDDAAGCQSGNAPICDDGDACNGVESCDKTLGCVNGNALDCDDTNPCTDDTCQSPGGACVFEPNDGTCPAGQCVAGECVPDCEQTWYGWAGIGTNNGWTCTDVCAVDGGLTVDWDDLAEQLAYCQQLHPDVNPPLVHETSNFSYPYWNPQHNRCNLNANGAMSQNFEGNGTTDYGDQILCKCENTACPNCGNGKIDAGEECDDGNTEDGDGCSAVCDNEIGLSPDAAGASCHDIKTQVPGSVDGTYWVDPDADGPLGAFQVLCDMTTEGGGWTVLYFVDAFHWNSHLLNNCFTGLGAPQYLNDSADIWDPTGLVPAISETLLGCGEKASDSYWVLSGGSFATQLFSKGSGGEPCTGGGYGSVETVTTNTGTTVGASATYKHANNAWVSATGYPAGTAQGITWGGGQVPQTNCSKANTPQCHTTCEPFGFFDSPWDGKCMAYPICNGSQTDSAEFMIAIR